MIQKIKSIKDFFLNRVCFCKNKNISDQALNWVKRNKRIIIKKFTEEKKPVPLRQKSIAIFMAGSPGAGKTEFSKRFINVLSRINSFGTSIVRIDGDEIRELLPI